MPLNPNALTDVATVKSFIDLTGSTYDNLIELLVNACSEWIENETGRVLLASEEDVIELHDGDFDYSGQNKIFAKQYPINSITSIEYKTGSLDNPTWVEFTENDYVVDERAGIIHFTNSFGGSLKSLLPNRQNIRLTYQGGYDNAPSDLALACIKMVAKEFNKRKSQGVTAESVGGGSVTWNEQVDPEVIKIIQKYRRFF